MKFKLNDIVRYASTKEYEIIVKHSGPDLMNEWPITAASRGNLNELLNLITDIFQ